MFRRRFASGFLESPSNSKTELFRRPSLHPAAAASAAAAGGRRQQQTHLHGSISETMMLMMQRLPQNLCSKSKSAQNTDEDGIIARFQRPLHLSLENIEHVLPSLPSPSPSLLPLGRRTTRRNLRISPEARYSAVTRTDGDIQEKLLYFVPR